jgi:hypothetical protein
VGRVQQQGTHDVACRIRRFGICSDLNTLVRSAQWEGRGRDLAEEWEPSGAFTAHDYDAGKDRFRGRVRSLHHNTIMRKR